MPSLTDLRSRVDVLRFRATQDMLARAKAAAEARRWEEAKAAYQQAIAASPESAFLYRDLANVERQAGQLADALEHYRRAVQLDPTDSKSLAAIGDVLEKQGDELGALAAYERTAAIEPADVPAGAIPRLRASRRPGETARGVSRHSRRIVADPRPHRRAGGRASRAAARDEPGRNR